MRSRTLASRTLAASTAHFSKVELENVLLHKLPVKRLQLADGSSVLVTTVYDLTWRTMAWSAV
jgi:nitrate reductase alpha subunit